VVRRKDPAKGKKAKLHGTKKKKWRQYPLSLLVLQNIRSHYQEKNGMKHGGKKGFKMKGDTSPLAGSQGGG